MRKSDRRMQIAPLGPMVAFFVFLNGLSSITAAEPIRLKNGMTILGRKLVMKSLGSDPVGLNALKQPGNGAIQNYSISRVENDWQIVFFPVAQQEFLDEKQIAILAGPEPVTFPLEKLPKKIEGKLASLGSISYVEDWDKHGRRLLRIDLPKKQLDVIQAIAEIKPDHVLVESVQVDWKLGLSLKSIPFEIIEQLIRKSTKQDDFRHRFAIARFMAEAEYFDQAFNELDAIERDFPAQTQAVAKHRANFMNYFGEDILRRLEKRKKAGQHILAEAYAKLLSSQQLTGTVKQNVQRYVDSYETDRRSIERTKQLLSDWQAKLEDTSQQEKLRPLRDEVMGQLNFETLPRMDSFLKAEAVSDYEPAQRLGLAYTGWVLGAANAEPDLDQAFRVWDARHVVLDYLRTDAAEQQYSLSRQLAEMENIGPEKVMNMVPQLPPILDASDVEPGVPHQVESSSNSPVRYWVVLPAEYSPHHEYPMVVALRSRNLTAEQTSQAWAGDKSRPDLGSQRGYIIIAPEYAERAQQEHTYGSPAHQYVLDSIRDARKRFAVDGDRVFLAGHGMGADAAFDIGMAHADQFAGVLPSGGGAVPANSPGAHYSNFYWENSLYTHWYVVGKGIFNGHRDPRSNRVFDEIMKRSKSDFVLVEYIGRNGDDLYDELPKSFDWMDLASHVRGPQPRKFEMRSLRKTDNRFFWITANGLPRDYILPSPPGDAPKVTAMDIKVESKPGNTIFLPGLTENYSLRLNDDLIDFDKQITVRVGSKQKFKGFVTRQAISILDELRQSGDRKRLTLAILTP